MTEWPYASYAAAPSLTICLNTNALIVTGKAPDQKLGKHQVD